ncbi:MAG: FtsW/RodA/SpoVE family cell cycle protein [Clostridiales bacterium]|nr:FtsW/RodA/SpoVE family cell cycle protein [Clostridiales bacterium]
MKKALPTIKNFCKRADMVLLSLCLTASIFGITMIASATSSLLNAPRYLFVQIIGLLIGLVLFVLFTVIDIDILAERWGAIIVFEVILALLLLTPLGYADNTGNRAWLRFGLFGIQPSEVIKAAFIVVMAKHITYLKEFKSLNSVMSVAQLVLHCMFIVGLLVIISKDMGSALVFLFIFFVMLFVGGLRIYWFLIGITGIAAVFPLFWTHVLTERYRQRILSPYDSSIDPSGFDIRWQANQSKIALASGQLKGMGYGNGNISQSVDALPAKQTDFIFSVIGEELGMIGCSIVILLLLAIIIRCIYVGAKSRNTMSMLVCFGVAAWLIFQTIENICMCIGIAPVIGITLPFFSYGGSSIFSLFAAMGLVSGVKYRPKPERFRVFR